MKLFELLPCVDLPGQCSLTVAPPIDLLVKQALARLERRPVVSGSMQSETWRLAARFVWKLASKNWLCSSNELTSLAADSKTSRR